MQFTLLAAPPWHRWVCDMEQVVGRAAVPLARWTPQNLHCQRCSPPLPPGQGTDWAQTAPVNVNGGQQVRSVSLVSSTSSGLCRYYLMPLWNSQFCCLCPSGRVTEGGRQMPAERQGLAVNGRKGMSGQAATGLDR